jgi:hypothetical protein
MKEFRVRISAALDLEQRAGDKGGAPPPAKWGHTKREWNMQ